MALHVKLHTLFLEVQKFDPDLAEKMLKNHSDPEILEKVVEEMKNHKHIPDHLHQKVKGVIDVHHQHRHSKQQ